LTTPAQDSRNLAVGDGKVAHQDKLTWYVCKGFSCSPPAVSVTEVADYLSVSRFGGT